MSDAVLSALIRNYVTSQPTPVVEFVWQGGEPTLLGIDFFKRVVEIQKPFQGAKTITNSLQTNGTLLDDAWGEFLRAHRFAVGISVDGPREIHDRYRRDRNWKGTFEQALRGLRLLRKHPEGLRKNEWNEEWVGAGIPERGKKPDALRMEFGRIIQSLVLAGRVSMDEESGLFCVAPEEE